MPHKISVKQYFKNKLEVAPKIGQNEDNQPKDISEPADFETAISATGYGKFNYLLLLVCIPTSWSCMFETTTMSYVFPAAQCDLDLSLDDKGFLNAITYIGTISSAMVWGFLYDTLGRKKLLMIGYMADAVCVIVGSLSQTKTLLIITKFFGGFIINGPFAAFTSYLSEFQSAENRARTQLILGAIFNFGTLSLPLLAWLIIPKEYNLKFFNMEMHSWNIYLLITSLPSVIAGIIFIFLPESPKFLMTIGKNEDALRIFRKVYHYNTGKPSDTYPIKELVDEIKLKEEELLKHGGHVTANRTKIQALREGWQQITPLFFKPHLKHLFLVVLLQTMFTLALNTLRLWLPQIFQAINDYQFYNNGSGADLCTMLDMIQPQNISGECEVNFNNSSVYSNSMIVASVTITSYFFAGYLINIVGKKRLLSILGLISGTCTMCLYFTTNIASTLATSSLFVATASISTNVVLTVIIDLFPTTLRTMTIAIAMMFARGGAVVGNLLFPILLRTGCAPPFFTLGSVIMACGVVAMTLPNTDMKALE